MFQSFLCKWIWIDCGSLYQNLVMSLKDKGDIFCIQGLMVWILSSRWKLMLKAKTDTMLKRQPLAQKYSNNEMNLCLKICKIIKNGSSWYNPIKNIKSRVNEEGFQHNLEEVLEDFLDRMGRGNHISYQDKVYIFIDYKSDRLISYATCSHY